MSGQWETHIFTMSSEGFLVGWLMLSSEDFIKMVYIEQVSQRIISRSNIWPGSLFSRNYIKLKKKSKTYVPYVKPTSQNMKTQAGKVGYGLIVYPF